jgi:cyclomaltodextrinase
LLIGLRRRHPWLHRAHTVVRHLTNRHIGYESVAGADRLGVALSVEDVPVRCGLPWAGEILAGAGVVHRPHGTDAQVELPPHGWAACRLGPAS